MNILKEETINTLKVAGKQLFKNRFNNLPILTHSTPLEHLRNVYTHHTAIIVASGPSLSKNINHLRTVRNRALIIATDSAVVPLINNGIMPDYIVTVDYRDLTYDKLKPVEYPLSDTYLIMLTSATTKIPSTIKFKEIYYASMNTTTTKMMDDLLNTNTTPLIEASSVTHLALFATQLFGCTEIVFTGLDLSYANGRDHIKGTVLNWGNNHIEDDNSIYVEGIDGAPVHTAPGFIVMKEIIEKMINSVPDIEYIDATEGGVRVQGTKVDKLKNVLNKLNRTVAPYHLTNQCSSTIVQYNLIKLKRKIVDINKIINLYGDNKRRVLNYIRMGGDLDNIPPAISRCISNMDAINNVLNEDEIIGYVKELLAEYHNEYVDSKSDHPLLNLIKQQVYVQGIRKKAIGIFLEIVDEQIVLFNKKLFGH